MAERINQKQVLLLETIKQQIAIQKLINRNIDNQRKKSLSDSVMATP